MNRQTRALRKLNLSTEVIKFTAVPKYGPGLGVSLTIKEFESSKGRLVDSAGERAARGRKPWRGHSSR